MKKNLINSLSLPRHRIICIAAFAAAHLTSAQETISYWSGGGADEYWKDAANWGGTLPSPGDSLEFGFSTYGGSLLLTNNFLADTAFNGTTFDDSEISSGTTLFTFFGNPVLLSGAAAGNTIGVANNSSGLQTVNLELDLDWGYHTFSGGSVGLALNASIRPYASYGVGSYVPVGGVAYFGGSGIQSAAPLDPTGLISGLGGAGLIGTNTLASPALATVLGGNVEQYNSYTRLTSLTSYGEFSGTANENIELGDTTSASYDNSLNPNTSVNTITVDQNPGNSSGNQTITVNNTGTLTLGALGGIYVTSAANGSYNILTLTGGTLTASGGFQSGMIVFGINGTTAGNQMELGSVVADNGSYPVTVVKTGPGSMYFNSTGNNYSGGTYVDQGYLQVNHSSSLGKGPVYVAADSEVYLATSKGNWANNFYISPGAGPAYSTDGAIKIGNGGSTVTLSGILNLLGNPVIRAPGDRIGMVGNNGQLLITGQVTGTGTLELTAEAANVSMQLFNESSAPNNWTGGLIIDNAGNDDSYVFDPGSQLAGNNVTLAQAGSGIAELYFSGTSDTIGGLNAASSANNIVENTGTGPSTLTLGVNNAGGSFGGIITDAGSPYTLSIVKIGTGTQTLNGANTYSGNTTISSGTLAIGPSGDLGGGSYSGSIINNGVFNYGGSGSQYLYGVISGSGALICSGELLLEGVNTYNGSTTINGTLQIDGSLGGGNYSANIVDNGLFNYAGSGAQTLSGVISGSGGLYDNGMLTLSGENTYSGPTSIGNDGTLALVGSGSIADSSQIDVEEGATFDVSGVPSSLVFNILTGGGFVNGNFSATFPSSTIHPGGLGEFSTTLTFHNNLGPIGNVIFDLSSTYNGPNDQIVLDGDDSTLDLEDTTITINSDGTLDTTHDYVLFDLTGTLPTIDPSLYTLQWVGITPPKASQWSIVTTSTQVLLHYTTATALPPVAYNQSVVTSENTPVVVTLTGSDLNNPPLSLLYNNGSPSNGGLSGTPPSLTYTPNLNFTGPDSFQFSDNNGSLVSSTATVSINVVPTGQNLNVSANASAGQTVTATLPPESGQAGVTATLGNASGTQPAAVTAAVYSSDPENSGVFDIGTTFLDLQVSGASAGDWLIAQFFDPGSPAIPPALYYYDPTTESWIQVRNSLFAPTDAGTSPTPVWDGLANWVFTVYLDGTSTPTLANLTGTVFAIGDFAPPVPGTNLIGTVENTPVNVPVAKLLATASSPNGGTLNISSVGATSAQGGTVALGSGLVTYTPTEGYFGSDSFTYILSDGFGIAQGTVQIVVTGSDAPPLNQLSLIVSNANLILQYSGVPGQEYVIQSASAVNGPWTDLSNDLTTDSTGLVTYTVPGPLPSQQFYRMRVGP